MKHSFLSCLFIIALHNLYGQLPKYRHVHAEKEYKGNRHGGQSNFFPDSIRVEFPDQQALVVFELKNYKHNRSFVESFSSTINEIHGYLENSLDDKAEKSSLAIHVSIGENNKKTISIQNRESQTNILVEDKAIVQLLPPGVEIYYQSDNEKVYVYVKNLADLVNLSQQNFLLITSGIAEESAQYFIGRKSIKSRFIVKNGIITYRKIQYAHPSDVLYVAANFSAGLLRDRVYPELGGAIGLSFNDRFGVRKRKVEFSYSSMYLVERNPEGGYTNNISSFLGASYSLNINSKGSQPIWIGAGAAFLVQEVGEYFKGKTMKFFIKSDIGNSKLSVIPEFYLTEDFKKHQFGLKLNYTF